MSDLELLNALLTLIGAMASAAAVVGAVLMMVRFPPLFFTVVLGFVFYRGRTSREGSANH